MLRNSYGRFLQHHELYPKLGLKPGAHLGTNGWTKEVEGVLFYCRPIPLRPTGRKSSKHRIFVRCTKCHTLIPFGRIGQHLKRRDHKEG